LPYKNRKYWRVLYHLFVTIIAGLFFIRNRAQQVEVIYRFAEASYDENQRCFAGDLKEQQVSSV